MAMTDRGHDMAGGAKTGFHFRLSALSYLVPVAAGCRWQERWNNKGFQLELNEDCVGIFAFGFTAHKS